MKCSLLILLIVPMVSLAWDGYDYDSGSYIEIDKGNAVKPGHEIEYYDYNAGEYKYGEVESVRSRGRNVEVEIIDYDSGDSRTFDMDR